MNRTELREKLNKIDCDTCNQYDLVNLFESVKLSNEDLNKLSRIVDNDKAVYNFLNEKAYPSVVFAKSDIVKSPKKLTEGKKATKRKRVIKEGFNGLDKDAIERIKELESSGEVDLTIATGDDGEDFLIVDSYEDIQKLQKAIDPNFEPEDKYDTSLLYDTWSGDWGFQDEYSVCDLCGKVIRTSPDSYSWTADFFADYEDGGMVCGDCVREDPENYLNALINNPKSANTILDKQGLEAEGFELIEDDYENGWYDRSDNPKEILEKALEEHPEAEFVFSISAQEQFRTNFELWGRGINKTLGEGNEDKKVEKTLSDFLDSGDFHTVLVDDARTFDIHQWEKDMAEEDEFDDTIEEDVSDADEHFIVTEEDVQKVLDKIASSNLFVANYYKNNAFMKGQGLTEDDIKAIVKKLDIGDYSHNMKSTKLSPGDVLTVFITDKDFSVNGKDLHGLVLYIKIDTDYGDPVAIVSVHNEHKSRRNLPNSNPYRQKVEKLLEEENTAKIEIRKEYSWYNVYLNNTMVLKHISKEDVDDIIAVLEKNNHPYIYKETESSRWADERRKEKEKVSEDTVKQGSHWINKGKEGTHGKFKTKKAADAQRKAMFAKGFSVNESVDPNTLPDDYVLLKSDITNYTDEDLDLYYNCIEEFACPDELEYEDLEVTIIKKQRDADDWDEDTYTISWTYHPDKDKVIDEVAEYLSEKFTDKITVGDIKNSAKDINKHLLDHFYEDAVEDARENYDFSYSDTFDEQLKEDKAKETMKSVVAKWRSRRSNKE